MDIKKNCYVMFVSICKKWGNKSWKNQDKEIINAYHMHKWKR